MNRERYATGTPWESVVGYSRAVRVGPFVFVFGTMATAEDGSIVGHLRHHLPFLAEKRAALGASRP